MLIFEVMVVGAPSGPSIDSFNGLHLKSNSFAFEETKPATPPMVVGS